MLPFGSKRFVSIASECRDPRRPRGRIVTGQLLAPRVLPKSSSRTIWQFQTWSRKRTQTEIGQFQTKTSKIKKKKITKGTSTWENQGVQALKSWDEKEMKINWRKEEKTEQKISLSKSLRKNANGQSVKSQKLSFEKVQFPIWSLSIFFPFWQKQLHRRNPKFW